MRSRLLDRALVLADRALARVSPHAAPLVLSVGVLACLMVAECRR